MGTFLDGYNFKGSPFKKQTRTVASWNDPEGVSSLPWQEESWVLNPESFAGANQELGIDFEGIINNPDNFQFVGQDANGNFLVKVKSADKQATTYVISPEGKNLGATGSEEWDTNQNVAKKIAHDPLALAMLLGTAGLGAAGAGLFGPGVAAATTPVTIGTEAGLAGIGEAAGALGGAAGAAVPNITPEMLTAANATSDPIAYLNAQAGWTAADPTYLASLTTVPPGTTTPGYAEPPAWPEASNAATPANSPPANQPAANQPAASKVSPLVKTLTDLGVPEGLAQAIVIGTPALAGLLADHDPQTATSSTTVSPTQQAAKDAVAGAVTEMLPAYRQRDLARADQQNQWAQAAAGLTGQYQMPQQVTGPAGMMGNYRPVRGLWG